MAANGGLQPQHRLGPLTPIPAWRPLLKSYSQLKGCTRLESHEAALLMQENSMNMDDLLQALVVPAAEIALPYLSGYFVGAVALGASGAIYFGANLELPGGGNLSQSVHAEQCLTANLLRHEERDIRAVAISAPPCGHCRQFFSEFACADKIRFLFGPSPDHVHTLAEILPYRFGPLDLLEDPSQPLLLYKQDHKLEWTPDAATKLGQLTPGTRDAAQMAFLRANSSYSPYTKCPAAIVLVSRIGLHCGSIVESAAHSPTYQPLQAALSVAMLDGLTDFSEVTAVILVEKAHVSLQQEAIVSAMLKTVSPQALLHVLHVREAT